MPLYICGGLLFRSVCVENHLRYQIPDCSSVKCLWAALYGFLSLRGLVVLNTDCCDVSPKPQPCLSCVTVTIYFHPVREEQLSLHRQSQFPDMDGWIKHCATVSGPELPP